MGARRMPGRRDDDRALSSQAAPMRCGLLSGPHLRENLLAGKPRIDAGLPSPGEAMGARPSRPDDPLMIIWFLLESRVKVLMIAGDRESGQPGIGTRVKRPLPSVFG